MSLIVLVTKATPVGAQAGTLTLSPDRGPVGTVVRIQGQNCALPGQTMLLLFVGGFGGSPGTQGSDSFGRATVDAPGRFEVSYRIPDYLAPRQGYGGGPVVPGKYAFETRPPNCGTPFEVTAAGAPRQGTLTLSPSRGPVGTLVQLRGQGCGDPGKRVEIHFVGGTDGAGGTLGSVRTELLDVTTDGQGRFESPYLVPAQLERLFGQPNRGGGPVQPARYLVRSWPPYCSAWFDVTSEPSPANLTVTPDRGSVGTLVKIQARQCTSPRLKGAKISFTGGTEGATGTLGVVRSHFSTEVDSAGGFELTYQIPQQLEQLTQPDGPGGGPLQPGRYKIQSGSHLCAAWFEVTRPEPSPPPPPPANARPDRPQSGTFLGLAMITALLGIVTAVLLLRRRRTPRLPSQDGELGHG